MSDERGAGAGPDALDLAPDVYIAPTATLRGAVRLASRANVWFGAVLDGTDAPVDLAEGANVQDNSEVRGTPGQPARLGVNAAMGHNARLIGATVDERSLIAIGATVLPGAVVGTGSIIAANATVPEGMRVPPRSLVVGNGRIVRQTTDDEVDRIHRTAGEYLRLSSEYRQQASDRTASSATPG